METAEVIGRPAALNLQQHIELHRLRASGATLRECRYWFDVSRSTVERYLKRPIPTPGELRAMEFPMTLKARS